jgi:conjugal transfer pilus assembly protein TraL
VNIDKHYMPRHLDDPYQIAYFSIGEVVVFLIPFFSALLICNSPLYGLIIGGIFVALIKRLKGQEGHYFIYHMAYWYLPQVIRFKSTPPSYIREMLG